jgi:signal recognition particle GTPase
MAVQNANYHLKVISDTETSSTTTEQVKKASPKRAQRKQNRAKSVQISKSPVQLSKSSPTERKLSKQKKHSSQMNTKKNQTNKERLPTILKPANPVNKKETNYNSLSDSLASLNINLDEVSHIINVLTKAEIEEKNFDEEFHQELLMGKTCFICMTVKFGIISWGYNCKICQKYVRFIFLIDL